MNVGYFEFNLTILVENFCPALLAAEASMGMFTFRDKLQTARTDF